MLIQDEAVMHAVQDAHQAEALQAAQSAYRSRLAHRQRRPISKVAPLRPRTLVGRAACRLIPAAC